MSKPLMFRGRRKDNGELVVGWYLCTVDGDRIIEANMSDEDVYCGFAWEDVSVPDGNSGCHEVHPDSVTQSTGKFDKNGVEIFGGMRIKYWTGHLSAPKEQIAIVEWDDELACWGHRNKFGLAPSIPPCEVIPAPEADK